MSRILTVRSVTTVRPAPARREIPDGVVPGLYLVVQPSGSKSWAVRYRLHGVSRKLTLGSAGIIDLVTARTKARRALEAVAAGDDPALLKRRSREPGIETFETVARRFIERHVKPHNRSWQERERILVVEVLPSWGRKPITAFSRPDVVSLLDGIVDRGSPIMANRTLGVVRRLFSWAVERGTLESSPCDRVKAPAPEVKRDRTLSDRELGLVFQAADRLGYPYGRMVQLLALTAARRQEIAGLRWSEFDPELTLWVLPKERAKNNVQHQVPLAPAVRTLLAGLPRFGSDLVFTNGTGAIGGFSQYKRRLDQTIATLNGGPIADWRVHDLRRTAASGLARLGVQLPVVEKILNHTGSSFAGAAGIYQKHSFSEEKRAALEVWARHVTELRP